MIFNMTGGAALNFKVETFSSETKLKAATPSANTIGIISSTPVTSYDFCASQPDEREEGMVWFKTNPAVGVAINAVKGNTIEVWPTFCRQVKDGVWTPVSAWLYTTKWKPIWDGVMYNAGEHYVQYETLATNGTVTQDDAYWICNTQAEKNCSAFVRLGKISATTLTKVSARFEVTDDVDGNHYCRLYMAKGENVSYDGAEYKTSINLAAGKSGTAVLELDGLTGPYYVYAGITADSDYAKARTVTIDKVWASM